MSQDCGKARQIIEEVYNLKEVDDCISKLVPSENRADFKQELFLKMLSLPCDKIAVEIKQFKFYLVRSILNMAKDNNLYKNKNTVYSGDIEQQKILYSYSPADFDSIGDRQQKEDEEQAMIDKVNNLDAVTGTFYHRKLVELIVKIGSMRAVSRHLGIPKSSISSTVKKVREHLSK